MNDAARQQLVVLITKHGRSLADDPRRCEALLRDYCGQYRREINVLIGALKERVAADLINSSAALPARALIAQLAKRLQDNLGFSQPASEWAVKSWALALGVATVADLEVERSAGPYDADDPFTQVTPEGTATSSPEETLRQALRIVFTDGIATEYERADLQRIRERLGLPVDVASRVFAEVKEERRQANAATQATPLAAATLTVSQERGSQYGSIGRAVESARPGTHILVRPGLYRESLVIDRPVSISADGPAGEVILESVGSPCLVTRAAQIKVQGLTLRSLINDGPGGYFAVDIGFGQIVLESCLISSDAGACISIHGPGVNPTIRRCRVHDGGNYGIWVWDDAAGVIEDCEISNCAGAGLVVSGDTMEEARQMAAYILADISDNRQVINQASVGLPGNAASSGGSNTVPLVRRCSIFGGQDHGIWVHYEGRALVEQCRVFENAAAGVWVDDGSEASIRHSNINHNRREAIRVTGDSSATVEDCDLRENGDGPWAVERGCQVRQSGNRV